MYSTSFSNNENNEIKSIKNNLNIDLKKHTNIDHYILNFNISNSNYNLDVLIKDSFINMFKQFNIDLTDSVFIDEENKVFVIYFKSFNSDLGIPKKFMLAKFNIDIDDELSKMKCICTPVKSEEENSILSNIFPINKKHYEEITINIFEVTIDYKNIHDCLFNVSFDIDIHEDLPIYMKNIKGLFIAKMFNNLKTFIENM